MKKNGPSRQQPTKLVSSSAQPSISFISTGNKAKSTAKKANFSNLHNIQTNLMMLTQIPKWSMCLTHTSSYAVFLLSRSPLVWSICWTNDKMIFLLKYFLMIEFSQILVMIWRKWWGVGVRICCYQFYRIWKFDIFKWHSISHDWQNMQYLEKMEILEILFVRGISLFDDKKRKE